MLFTCCVHITVALHFVFYQVKLSVVSVVQYFSLKSTEPYSSTNNFELQILVSDWFLYSAGEIWGFIKERNEYNKNTNFMIKTTQECQKSR